MADRLMTRFMLGPQWSKRLLVMPERLARLLGFRLDSVPLVAVLLAFFSMWAFGWVIDVVEMYLPQFNAWMLAHKMGLGIVLYVLLIVTWSSFWTAVMLSPRYEKFTSELWRRRVRLDDPFEGAEEFARNNPFGRG